MSTAKDRRTLLRQLLMEGRPGTQAELCDALRERGYPATQSTVSRDLKLLGAQRTLRDDGSFAYHLGGDNGGPFPAEMIVGVDHNEAMVVIRTQVGRAQAVGLDLDALGHPDVLGTLAGDDTVLVIPRSTRITEALAAEIRDLAGVE